MRFLKGLLWLAAIVGILVAIVHYAFLDAWTVPSDDPQLAASVEPTLTAGDIVLVSKNGTPVFGDLVRCADPDAPGRYVIGRIVGEPRDKVDVQQEAAIVNGKSSPTSSPCSPPTKTIHHPAMDTDLELQCFNQEFAGSSHQLLKYTEHPEGAVHATVDASKVYLLSDDRHIHLDSRDFGQVEQVTCKHIVFRLWGKTGFSDAQHRFTYVH